MNRKEESTFAEPRKVRTAPGMIARFPGLWPLVAAISAISFAALLTFFWLLYATARQQELDDLERTTELLAALMESVARFDAQYSTATDPQGSRGATLRQLRQGLAGYMGRREGDELVLGQKADSRLQVFRVNPAGNFETAAEFELNGTIGLPLRQALEGQHGKGIFFDYNGIPVLAAFAPVPSLKIGVVFKKDIAAFNAPFLRAGAWALAIYLCLVMALVAMYRRSTRSLSQSLQASETRYRRLHESMIDAFVQVEMDGRIVECNQAYREMLGYTDEELRQLSYMDLTPEPWHEFEARIVREQILPRGASDLYQKEYRRKDGTVIPVELRTYLLRDDAGMPTAMWAMVRDISERRLVENKLAEREAQWRTVVDGASDGFLIADLETRRFVFGNPAICRMLGVTREELLAMDFGAIHPPESLPELGQKFAAIARGEVAVVADVPLLCKDGSIRTVDISGAVVTFGGRSCNLGVFHDVGERKQAEARLRAIIDVSPVPMALNDETLRITYINRSFIATYGYELEDIPTLTDWWPKAYPDPAYRQWVVDSWLAEIERMTRTQTAFTPLEVKIRCKDGTERIALASAAIMERNTSVVALLDITEIKQAEMTARDREDRLNQAQRIAQVGSWDLDLVSGRLLWSREIYRLFEIDPEKFGATYEAFLNAIHPEDREMVNQAYSNSLVTREPYQIDHRLLMADGRVKYVQERCDSTFDEQGKPLSSRGTVQDITERVLAERKIASALREKEVLLKEIYHRVKNNLQVVSSLLIMQGSGAGEEARALLAESANRVKSMALVHEQLYQSTDLASIDLPLYVQQLLQQLRQLNDQMAERVQINAEVDQIRLGLETAVPLGLMVNELVSNSFKHAYPDERRGQIDLRLRRLGDGALALTLTDDGIGLPPDFVLERLKSLGMRLVVALAEQLGGKLEYGPGAQGRGACFTLRFMPEDAEANRLNEVVE